MHHLYLRESIIVIFFLLLGSIQVVAQTMTNFQLTEKIKEHMLANQSIFNWSEASQEEIWSALILSDSIAVVGYQPKGFDNLRSKIHEVDIHAVAWSEARQKLITFLKTKYFELEGIEISTRELIPFSTNKTLPYFFVKIHHEETIAELMEFPEIRYFEPTGYDFIPNQERSGEGCGDYATNLSSSDYTNISPMAVQSWVHQEHNIDQAWNKTQQGEGVWVAVMDSGISDLNPKFNSEFEEGESIGRTIEKNGFYQNDGWADQCGHGTAMAGLIAAPRGYDNMPAGVAYRTNLITYRVTNDVRINSTDEIVGLGNALIHAGDDSRIQIISISLGDVFSSGPVEDGVIYAHNLGKLIFAAAGTSTSFTDWFGVIFPATMPETVAVTGAVEGTNFERCEICHDGSEVEFVIYMERNVSGNKAVTSTNDQDQGDFHGYVGGSSAATAIMAGTAALVWGNNQDFDKNQIINRLIQTSSNYPNKDDNFGWGAIDAEAAVDSSFLLPCSSSLSNEVTLEITSISFPSTGDTGSDAEWVLTLGNQSFYFNVPTSGATGNPSSFIDVGICNSSLPIIIDLGNTVCGEASLPLFIESYEDDSTSSNCDFDEGWWFNSDDDLTTQTGNIQLSENAIIHNSSAGDFIIEYVLYCSPTLVAGLTDDSPKCYGENISFVASPQGESNYLFFVDSNLNGEHDAGEELQDGLVNTLSMAGLINENVIGVKVTSADGCRDYSLTSVFVSAPDYAGPNMLVGSMNEVKQYETDGIIESTQSLGSESDVRYDSSTEIELLAGFEMENGALFEIKIDGCDQDPDSINDTEQIKN